MTKRCEDCEWARDQVWYFEGMELSTLKCTLGNTCLAEDCEDFYPELPEEIYTGVLSYNRKHERVFPVPIGRDNE